MSWDEKASAQDLIDSCGDVLVSGHFVGQSGRHLDTYFAKNNIFTHPEQFVRLCRKMWYPFVQRHPWPYPAPGATQKRTVVGPESGGARIARFCADDINAQYDHYAKLLCADKSRVVEAIAVCVAKSPDGDFLLTDEQREQLNGSDCIIVEDVLTTGGSVRRVVDLVRTTRANIVRVAAIVNRGGVTSEMVGARLEALLTLHLPSWSAEECALHGPCSRGEPVRTDLGHGAKYVKT